MRNNKDRNKKCPCGSGIKQKKCHGKPGIFLNTRIFLADKNVESLLMHVANQTQLKADNFLTSKNTKWIDTIAEINEKEKTIFSAEHYTLLIYLIINNAKKMGGKTCESTTLKELQSIFIHDFSNINEECDEDKYPLTFAFASQQFEHSLSQSFVDDISRTHSLIEIASQIRKLNLNEKFKEKYELDIEECFRYLIVLLFLATKGITLNNIPQKFILSLNLNNEKFKKTIDRYTYTLDTVKEDFDLINRFFILINRHILCPNVISFMHYVGHAVYWLVRDLYKNETTFIDQFGSFIFPEYIRKIFNKNNIAFFDIDKDETSANKHTKKGDFRFETNNYIFIVEAKSYYAKTSLKSYKHNIEDYKNLRRKLAKGISQAYEEANKIKCENKKIIKMILTLETFPFSHQLRDSIMQFDEDIKKLSISDPEYYAFCDISSFESLIYILSKNERLFENIIEEKIKLEKAVKIGLPVNEKYSIKLKMIDNADTFNYLNKSRLICIDFWHILAVNRKLYNLKTTMSNNFFSDIISKITTNTNHNS